MLRFLIVVAVSTDPKHTAIEYLGPLYLASYIEKYSKINEIDFKIIFSQGNYNFSHYDPDVVGISSVTETFNVAKSIATKVNNKELIIKPTRAQVTIQDGNLEIKAPELTIIDEVLRVGNSEVKLTASDVVEKIKIEPKEIELKEENARAVYKIKTDEDRKLFGFIPVKVEKTLTADATGTEVEIIKEAKPWWAFLTTK